MMASFLDAATTYIGQTWHVRHLLLVVLAAVLALVLRRVAPRLPGFVWQMLMLVIVLFVGSAVAAGLHSHTVARPLHELAVLILGMVLIRQLCLVFFRLIIVRLGMRPPRILEEILILLAFVGWILVRLSMAGLELGSLVASTAVLTAVLAFAMQDTLGNILSGLALQLDHSVHIGDWIEIEDVSGEVIQVQWRHTAIRTVFGEIVVIPNSQLMKLRIKLIGGPSVPYRVRIVQFYADYDLRPSRVMHAVNESLTGSNLLGVSPDFEAHCRLGGFEHGLIVYQVVYGLDNPALGGGTDGRVLHHVFTVFQRNGWRLGVPGQEILLSSHRARGQQQEGRIHHELTARRKMLAAIDLFSPLTDDEVQQVAQALKTTFYLKGATLTRQGSIGETLFIVVSGEVDVWLEEASQRHRVAVVGSGEVLGEMSLLTGEPRRATLTASTDVECYLLDRELFQHLVTNRPELADAFAALLSDRNKGLSQLRDDVKERSPEVTPEQAALLARIRAFFGLQRR